MTATVRFYAWIFNWVDFGVACTAKRAEFNLTQRQVADMIGYSPTLVCGIENGTGEGNHHLEAIIRLANVLELNLPEFFEVEPLEQPYPHMLPPQNT